MKGLIGKLAAKAGYEIRRVQEVEKPNARKIHFLHIGKNAGTQVSNIAEQINLASQHRSIVKRKHDTFLQDIPEGDDYFFSIRDSVSRFKSGFYSRKRKGQPRIYSEWSKYDEAAFSDFEHANDLAESLFETGDLGHKAWGAMKSLRHTAQNQSDWFVRCGNFLRVRPPLWIIRQENFEGDMINFIRAANLGLSEEAISFGGDDTKSHRNDYTGIPPLSKKAEENLKVWYAQDIAFYAMCEDWIENGGRGSSS